MIVMYSTEMIEPKVGIIPKLPLPKNRSRPPETPVSLPEPPEPTRLLHDHRSAYRDILKKLLGHVMGHANAAMGCGEARQKPGVHPHPTREPHEIGAEAQWR